MRSAFLAFLASLSLVAYVNAQEEVDNQFVGEDELDAQRFYENDVDEGDGGLYDDQVPPGSESDYLRPEDIDAGSEFPADDVLGEQGEYSDDADFGPPEEDDYDGGDYSSF